MARRSAEPGCNGKTHSTRRSDRFLAGLANAESVILVSHVHPDPDSLGSMLGLAHLIDVCLDKPTCLTRDGAICRAENRALVENLKLQLEPIEDMTWKEGDALVMVDSQPNTGRHNFDPTFRSMPSSITTTRRAIRQFHSSIFRRPCHLLDGANTSWSRKSMYLGWRRPFVAASSPN